MTDQKKTTPALFPVHGVDLSEHNAPELLPVSAEFVIVRATFGSRKDKRTVDHVNHARETGRAVGLYHFFVPGEAVDHQLANLIEQADLVGYGEGSDVIPWIDIEPPDAAGKMLPCKAWVPSLEDLIEKIETVWGDCGSYISQANFILLGSPSSLLERPLWVPHYRSTAGDPATPGGVRPAIWQYRVGPWSKGQLHVRGQDRNARAVDHDCVMGELPKLGEPRQEPTRPGPRVLRAPTLGLDDEYWKEHRAARDAQIHGI